MRILSKKKGILGLDTVKSVVITLLVLAVITIAAFLALVSLQNANIFTGAYGSGPGNMSNNIIANITSGASSFFSQVPTFFVLLGVVVLILIITIVIVAVTRFSPGGRSESL